MQELKKILVGIFKSSEISNPVSNSFTTWIIYY